MKRSLIYGLVTVLLAVNLAVGARLYLASAADAQKDSAYPNLHLFSYVMEKVRKNYVDGQNLTYQDLVYNALKGMVGDLDPHSEFLDPEEYQELQSDTEGVFGGLGIVVQMRDNYLTVVAPIEDTPGAKAGILAGDRIIRINGVGTEKTSLSDAVKELRGEPGSDVTITIQRPSTGDVRDITVTRAVINVDMVKDINGNKEFPLGPDKIGYVRITQFGEKTGEELEAALRKLKAQGMKALVLDLRWNPGGLLDQAVAVCEKFLPRGQLIVTTEGRNSDQNVIHRADGRGDELRGMPMVVLVNGWSASASEIVAGCMQDTHRAVILGQTTFGKGLVQSIFPLPDNEGALKLTTAKYYTPSHKVIQEHGITPDCVVTMTDAEDQAAEFRRATGGLDALNSKERTLAAETPDPQLDRADDLLKGILLYAQRAPAEQRLASRDIKTATK
jgi:carboxyl-terminal processing protease